MAPARLNRGELPEFSNVAGFGVALAGIIWAAVAVIHQHINAWPVPLLVPFYVGLFLALYVFIAGGLKEAFRLYRWATRGTREQESTAARRDEELERRVEAIESEPSAAIKSVLETLVNDDVARLRHDVENLTNELRQVRFENENLRNNFNLVEEQSKRFARERQEAIDAQKAAVADADVAIHMAEAEALDAKNKLARLEFISEKEASLRNWGASLLANARQQLSSQVEIVDYRFHMQELGERVNAAFGVSVRIRYWGVLPAFIEAAEYYGRFTFQQRRMARDPEIGRARIERGEDVWLLIRQPLEGDLAAVREDWEKGSILVDGSSVKLAIRCDDPTGGAVIAGEFRLQEMQWPKPVKA